MMGMPVSPVGCWLGRLVLALVGVLFFVFSGQSPVVSGQGAAFALDYLAWWRAGALPRG